MGISLTIPTVARLDAKGLTVAGHNLAIIPRPEPEPLAPATVLSAQVVIEAWLAGRNENSMKAHFKDLASFARYLKIKGKGAGVAAAETLLNADPFEAKRLARGFRAHLRERGLAPATIARRMVTLRMMVKVAREVGAVTWALDVGGKVDEKVESYRDTKGPSKEDWEKLLFKAVQLGGRGGAADKRNLAIVLLLRDQAFRRTEGAAALNLSDVDLEAKTVMITGKGKSQSRAFGINERTRAALREWIAARGRRPGPLFTRLDRAVPAGELRRLGAESINLMIGRLGRRAGIEKRVRAHGLRHNAITAALDETDGDIRRVARFSRHAKLDTVVIYDDRRVDDHAAIACLLGGEKD